MSPFQMDARHVRGFARHFSPYNEALAPPARRSPRTDQLVIPPRLADVRASAHR
jgi:hypothetical protein